MTSALPSLESITAPLDFTLVSVGDTQVTLGLILRFILYVATLAVVARLVRRRIVNVVLRRYDVGVRYATARISAYTVWGLGVLVGLPMVGLNLNSVMVALGALGVGIGFGLQHNVDNFVSGLILLFERPVKVGDRVHVGDLIGTVRAIQARVTTVVTNENLTILVPNSELVRDRVVNLSNQEQVVRFRFSIGVAYSSDLDEVHRVLLEVAKANSRVLPYPAPEVLLIGFGDSSIDFDLRVATSDAIHYPDILRSEIYFAIWRAFREHRIEIPFPQRDVHLRSVPAALHPTTRREAEPLAPEEG